MAIKIAGSGRKSPGNYIARGNGISACRQRESNRKIRDRDREKEKDFLPKIFIARCDRRGIGWLGSGSDLRLSASPPPPSSFSWHRNNVRSRNNRRKEKEEKKIKSLTRTPMRETMWRDSVSREL